MKAFLNYVDPDNVADEIARFETATPTLFREPGFVADYIRKPHVRSAIVTIDGKEAYAIAFRTTEDGGFWVDLAQSISAKRDVAGVSAPGPVTAGQSLHELFRLINDTAKSFGCRYIRFTTARHGLIQVAQTQGYTPEAVLMTKAVL